VAKHSTAYMRARIYLISIIIATAFSIFTYGKLKLFQATKITLLNKEIILNSEIIISLIILSTLLFVLLIGWIDKIFFIKKPSKIIEEEED